MLDLIQIVYVSHPAFEVVDVINNKIMRILVEARNNNPKLGIGGVLYYADGCFFQCLEGDRLVVEKLFAAIKEDPRHKDIVVIANRSISERAFHSWTMRYVPVQERVTQLLRARGFDTFNPYKFKIAMVDEVLGILASIEDSADDNQSPLAEGWAERFFKFWNTAS